MVFKVRRDKIISIIYLAIILLAFFLVIYATISIVQGEVDILLGAFNGLIGLAAAVFIILIYLNTHYELQNKFMVVRSGPFKDEIRYNKIEHIEIVNSLAFGAALSRNRIKLYCGQRANGRPHIVYVSPIKQEEFIKILTKNAPKAKWIKK